MKKPRRVCLITHVVSECSLPEFIIALPLLFRALAANPFRDSYQASSLFPLATASLSSSPAVVNHEGLKFYEDPIAWLPSRHGKRIPMMTSQKSCKSKPWRHLLSIRCLILTGTRLLHSGENSDLEIASCGNIFKVHSFLFCIRSKLFAAAYNGKIQVQYLQTLSRPLTAT